MNDLLDYCAECVRNCGCSRFDTLTVPHQIQWDGGGGIVAQYECTERHEWRCRWSAELWFGQDTDAA
ncbi:MAG: hypothetical protein K0U84_05355 [Actinomycetia bacterium]|nr:hypothetical protein [Actinomycetes bacterium]